MNRILYIVVPCYNEEEILEYSANILEQKLEYLIENEKISKDSKIMLVDDGSCDRTWDIICELNRKNKFFTGIRLSKNEGHQNALLAGLLTAKNFADITISLDADLQDDVNAIDEMVEKNKKGYNIVYGVRNNRETDSFFKKKSAELFYKFMNLLGAKTIFNHADFRLMDKKALNSLEKFKETNLFLREMIPNLGFKSCRVYYKREKRKAGTSKYPLPKMIAFAMNGISSCSAKVMHFISAIGFIAIFFSIIMLFRNMVHLFRKIHISSQEWLNTSVWLIGGLILFFLGIIGEYIGKIYMETKKRPRFLISENLNDLETKN